MSELSEQSNAVATIDEAPAATNGKALIFERIAGGKVLSEVCRTMLGLAESYPEADIRGPSNDYNRRSTLQHTNSYSLGRNKVKQRGVTSKLAHLWLPEEVPSVLEARQVKAETVTVRPGKEGEYYVSVVFNEDDAAALIEERKAVWGVIAQLGRFSAQDIPWLDTREPDVQLGYVATDPYRDGPLDILVDKLEESIEAVLPFAVQFSPIYDHPLEV